MEQLQSSMDTKEKEQKAVTSRRTKEKSSTKHPYKPFKRSYPEEILEKTDYP